jgi:salicylate hydroxylase
MGSGGHVLTFSVNHGKTLNIVAFYTSKDEWADYPRLIRTGTREEALRDFADYGHDVTELLKLVEPELSVVSLSRTREPLRLARNSSVI